MFGQPDVLQGPGPGRLQPGDLPVDRAIVVMCARQVTGTDQELMYDFPASENEGFLEQFGPLLQGERSLRIQPAFEGAEFRTQVLDPAGVFDYRLDL